MLLPKNYREFLEEAMRLGRDTDRKAEPYSPACLSNHHQLCSGFLPTDYAKGQVTDREECICFCHAQD